MTPAERQELDEALAYLYANNEEAPLIAFVERLTAGEEYEVEDMHNMHGIRVRVIKVPPQEFHPGDRVHVTRIEEGT